MSFDLGQAVPVTFLQGEFTGDGSATYLLGDGNRALITSIGGSMQTDLSAVVEFQANGYDFWAQELGVGSGLAPIEALGIWVPVEAGTTIGVIFAQTGVIATCNYLVAGLLFGAFTE